MVKIQNYFLSSAETKSATLLFLMLVFALLWANSPFVDSYIDFCSSTQFWINEGLMTLFFLLVGIELKQDFLYGNLSRISYAILPIISAIVGMIVPAIIYTIINIHDTHALKGWAIPVATDIAFASGILTLFGKRIPQGLKIFLLILAVVDDIGAILIIGTFYTLHLEYLYLLLALIFFCLLLFLNYSRTIKWWLYVILGIGLWYTLLQGGIHATLAGVLFAFTLPSAKNPETSILNGVQTHLHPWVSFFVMPLFALANAGITLTNISGDIFFSQLVFGIVAGLFIGKQLGVFGSVYILVKIGIAKIPKNVTWLEIYAVSLLCGIGFTMSLFLGTLSFQNDELYLTKVRIGVIMGSLLSGFVGAMLMKFALIAKAKKI